MASIPSIERQLKALAHFRRLHILRLIRQQRTMTVSDIAKAVGTTIFPVSQHLRILRNAGILESTKRGRHVAYRLSLKQSDVVKDVLKHL